MSSAVPCCLVFTSPRSRRHSLPLASAQARILYEPAPHPKMYTDICQLSGIWMDGWMTASLPPSQRAGLYMYTLRVCLCVCCKWIIKHFFPHSSLTLKSHVLCPSRQSQSQSAKSPSTFTYCFSIAFLSSSSCSSTSCGVFSLSLAFSTCRIVVLFLGFL